MRQELTPMGPFTRLFITCVIVLDLVAVVFFGGHFLLYGSILPEEVSGAEIAKLIPVETASADTPKPAAEPVKEVKLLPPNPKKGFTISAKCRVCHSFDKDGGNRIGPNLWGVYNRPIGTESGFDYSSAFMAKKGSFKWDDDHLNSWVKSPRSDIPGTKMGFAGLPDAQDRLDLIAYLKTLK